MIGVTILANLAFLSLRHANEDPYIDFIQLVANAVLLVLFTLEVSMKLFGLGWRQFIDSGWNAYDVIILFASAVGAAFDVGTLGLLLRSLRVFRLVSSHGLLHLVLPYLRNRVSHRAVSHHSRICNADASCQHVYVLFTAIR